MLKRFLKKSLTIGFCLVVLGAGVGVYMARPMLPKEPKVLIEKGMTLKEISTRLEQQGIVRNRWLFMMYAYGLRKQNSLKAGEYLFEKPVTPFTVLDYLSRGISQVIKVLIIEGWTLQQITDYLGDLPFKEPNFKQEFLRLSKDLEGYLFPNTYHLISETQPSEALKIFTTEFQKNYQKALQELNVSPTLSQNQIITLASVIEKETGTETERPLIASVFYNRLAKKMPLQSDPTVIYGLKNFDGNIRKADLSNPHPYNTYVHAGLPPGPICNPGLNAIRAALKPEQTNFLYFVSKQDGTHYFSSTVAEHAEAVRLFQIKGSP